MKAFFVAALFAWCSTSAHCQNNKGNRTDFINQMRLAASQPPAVGFERSFHNIPGPALKIRKDSFLKYVSIKPVIQSKPGKTGGILKKMRNDNSFRRPSSRPVCEDTSYRRLIGVHNGYMFVQSASQCTDGGLFVCALMHDTTALPDPWAKGYGLLVKLDADGNVAWLRQFEDVSVEKSWFLVMKAIELPNHDIICAGLLNTNLITDRYQTMVYRLTSSGSIIWQNCLRSDIGIFNSPAGSFTYWVESAAEGLNGDVILCGTTNSNLSSGKIETVVRLNNKGQLVWDANYGNHGYDGSYLFGAEGISAFVQNGKIILVGLSHGSNYTSTPPAVNFLTLDYKNGNLLAKRFFKPDYPTIQETFDKSFTYWANNFIRLANGHSIFYGKLLSGFINSSGTKNYFGVMEFDASFNLVKAYAISGDLATNYSNNVLYFDSSGKGLISVFEYIDSYEANLFFGAFNNQQFQNQRQGHYTNAGLPGNNGFAFLKDNAYAFVQSYFEGQPVTRSYFEFKKMHNSDTSSSCLGTDTMLFHFLPLHVIEDPDYYYLDANEPNKMVALPQQVNVTDTLSTSTVNPCLQINYCDTVKIHGNPVICGNSPSMIFTAFKNLACGAAVQWKISGDVIDSLEALSDSSVKIWFKNINWQGKLYTSLPAGKCTMEAKDSVPVSVIRLQDKINLGPDTVICSGNSILLHAANSFSSYLWQDGSTDSLLAVTTPGTYWVHASDFCGNNFADTIMISPFNVSVNAGTDRTKCNDDTLQLDAPEGFIGYRWMNNYNINSTTARQVIINPAVDTFYYLRAEKWPGCFAHDTVHVTVYRSAIINLGNDTSFCAGQSVTLSAGTGFTAYLWNNSSTAADIEATAAGMYAVKATSPEGCFSYDTLNVVNVYALPVVKLDHNDELCAGTTRSLDAGVYSSYLWQDASTGRIFNVHNKGDYAVVVTDIHGCTGSDTTHIRKVNDPPSAFLPADTAICSYGTIELKPSEIFDTYLWSNNGTASSIVIDQPGRYWLQVRDNNNCTGRDTVEVKLKQCLQGLYVPNAFTPNNDNKNDNLKALLFGDIALFEFSIYNRFGQMMFQTNDTNTGWDGKFKGKEQPPGIYVWVCRYRFKGEKEKVLRNQVSLLR